MWTYEDGRVRYLFERGGRERERRDGKILLLSFLFYVVTNMRKKRREKGEKDRKGREGRRGRRR